MVAVIVYILINLFLGFGYMLQETPNAVVNAYVEEAEYTSVVAALKRAPPWYCDSSATDYNFSATWTYVDNKCDFGLDMGDILTKGESAVFITTYFQDTPTNATAAAAAGLPSKQNFFVPGVEAMRLSFDHTVTTSWGLSAFNPELTLTNSDSSENKKENVTFVAGSTVNVTVADLLGIAGADLNAKNINPVSGPLYRLTGTHVSVAMKYTNMRSEAPMDRTVKTAGRGRGVGDGRGGARKQGGTVDWANLYTWRILYSYVCGAPLNLKCLSSLLFYIREPPIDVNV